MATTSSTTPTGSPHTYNSDRTENKTLYWVLGALAIVLLAGLVYAYSGRTVESVTTTTTMEATPATNIDTAPGGTMTQPSERGTTGTESQMNMGVGGEATPDAGREPQNTDGVAPATPDQVR